VTVFASSSTRQPNGFEVTMDNLQPFRRGMQLELIHFTQLREMVQTILRHAYFSSSDEHLMHQPSYTKLHSDAFRRSSAASSGSAFCNQAYERWWIKCWFDEDK